jgi:hypothetical protein
VPAADILSPDITPDNAAETTGDEEEGDDDHDCTMEMPAIQTDELNSATEEGRTE